MLIMFKQIINKTNMAKDLAKILLLMCVWCTYLTLCSLNVTHDNINMLYHSLHVIHPQPTYLLILLLPLIIPYLYARYYIGLYTLSLLVC